MGCAPLLVIGALLAMSSPAAAAVVNCGDVITTSTTLSNDVGPCLSNGIYVRGDNVDLNLNGHRVFMTENRSSENVGVRVDNRRNVAVRNGKISGFDAGVALLSGGQNHVMQLDVRDNINDNIATQNPEQDCVYGDGITTTDSSGNMIHDNRVVHNGPYSGISLVGDSDGNQVMNNAVGDNNVPNEDAAPGVQGNGNCGSPFSRPVQDIGIRIEGPGASGNDVHDNRVLNSAIGGITVNGFVFNPPMGPPQQPNTKNRIALNYVADTGKQTYTTDRLADGIAILRQGPGGVVGVSQGNTIEKNTVVRSFRHGIFLGDPRCGNAGTPPTLSCQPGPYTGTKVRGNTITGSLEDGIRVPGPASAPGSPGSINNTIVGNFAHDNGDNSVFGHDGHDDNVNCDNNVWSMNDFEFVNQPCVGSPPAAIR